MDQDEQPECSRTEAGLAALRRELQLLPIPRDTELLAHRLLERLAALDHPAGDQSAPQGIPCQIIGLPPVTAIVAPET